MKDRKKEKKDIEERPLDARNLGDGGKQFRGVAVFSLVEGLFGVTDFQEVACAHDGDPRGNLRDDGKAIRDEDVG